MPDVSGLVKKADYSTKISNIEKNHFTTDYNKFTIEILDAEKKEKII